jgi:hypothetical protein
VASPGKPGKAESELVSGGALVRRGRLAHDDVAPESLVAQAQMASRATSRGSEDQARPAGLARDEVWSLALKTGIVTVSTPLIRPGAVYRTRTRLQYKQKDAVELSEQPC